MQPKETTSGGAGLERSCRPPAGDWITSVGPVSGVELFRAWFGGRAYCKHRHDTYAVGVTDSGVQVFDYRGSVRASRPGQVVVLHPDEAHDGRAGTEPVFTSARLARAIRRAFVSPLESLAVDRLLVDLAEGLLAGERGAGGPAPSRRVDVAAVGRARQFLDAERTRVVHSSELEALTGLTRYDLARQFRLVLGTSPYRYLLMRRLELARRQIDLERPLAEVAGAAGFADQAHFTRVFKAALGLTPARYRALRARRVA